MRYRYRSEDELKDSGVEWLGKIPKDWEVKKIKHLFELKKDKSDEENPTVLSLTQKGLRIRDVSNNEGQLASTYVGYTKIEKNDFILNPMDLISGYTDKAEIEGVISPAYTTFRSKNKVNINHDYYKRYFQMHYHHNFLFPWGEGVSFEHRWTLKNEVFLNLPVITNALEEQEKIANFLDEKTSQFDLIISKKEKLIERLEEAKKSLISEVATGKVKVVKTDDGYELVKRSSEEMKDSGVEWLGEIPKDWDLKAIKYLFQLRNERNYKEMKDVQLLSLFTSLGVMKQGEVEARGNKVRTVEDYKEVYPNDIVVNIILAWMGAIGMSEHRGVISPAYDIYKPINNNIVSKYYHYLFRTPRFSGECYKKGRGIMDMRWRTYSDEFKSIIVTSPKVEEKNNIVKCLDEKINSIDNLIKSTQKQIEKLKEAKQSLISEAVTGKIEILD